MTFSLGPFIFIPIEQATVPPPGLIQHFKDKFWMIHPEKGVMFYGKKHMAPQCNSSEEICKRLSSAYPWAEIRFIPSVFKRIDPHDYCDC